MTSHIIMWDKDKEPSTATFKQVMKLIPDNCIFTGSKILDIPERGEVQAFIFSPPSGEFDLDNLFECTWTAPIIHDITQSSQEVDLTSAVDQDQHNSKCQN